MTTFNKVRDIFYSGSHAFRGDQDSISEIAFLIDEKYLSLSIITVASKNKYKSLLDNPDKLKWFYEAAGGGNTHIALKILTSKYLDTKGKFNSSYEHPFCGYYPDVLSYDKSIVAECGHTANPEKILTYFRQGNIRKCIQVPYPTDEDKDVKGYVFTARKTLKDFLIFLEKEKRSESKSLFFKRS